MNIVVGNKNLEGKKSIEKGMQWRPEKQRWIHQECDEESDGIVLDPEDRTTDILNEKSDQLTNSDIY
ncbi:hypothetical protein KY290_036943 [Solanum tuberosum]|uniref:Uncharacterized protein n=1 Tax=Solanum tuberosum TaxID=4113 RepID=A0ABQ7TUW5_SOLTU|nr:hypothetical protein KY290_036943 [Solanum tuberosum]